MVSDFGDSEQSNGKDNTRKAIFAFLIMLLSLASIGIADAKSDGHITLLAVSESSDGKYEGSTADMFLEIKPGSGRVFIDTFPITKLDTQMTTRFAKEMACKFLDKDCSGLDFFYTIKAQSSIIAGPSAGAATTILTISVLGDIDLSEDTVITGTINSGYLVGHVGGLKEKIEAAAKKGSRKVLIPIGESAPIMQSAALVENNTEKDMNSSSIVDSPDAVNLTLIGKNLNISVIEVSDIYDAMYEFTGKQYRKDGSKITISKDYEKIMKGLAVSLCNRTDEIFSRIDWSRSNLSKFEYARNLSFNSAKEFENGRYYSAASLCFGANVNYQQEYFIQRNLSAIEYSMSVIKAKNEADEFLQSIDKREITTITDLEASIIVKERLSDAKYYADEVRKTNSTSEKARLLSYSLERLNSAYLWNEFFGQDGQKIILDKEALKESCQIKISEAEERYQYASLYFPDLLIEIKAEINHAYDYYSKEEYEFCLFKATQAKARSNVILSSISVDTGKIDILLDQKLSAAKRTISDELEKGIFPVLGYSYYEYANTLKNDDKLSALIYSEYALELSNIDMYFKKKDKGFRFLINYSLLSLFISGVLLGYAIHHLISRAERKRAEREEKKQSAVLKRKNKKK